MLSELHIRGHVRIRVHPAGYVYHRGNYQSGRVLMDDPNTIIPAGRDYLATLLIKDGTNLAYTPGITQVGLWAGGIERYKADLTDRYTTGSNAVGVLFVTTTQPSGQPYTFNEVRLYANSSGSVYVAQKTGLNIEKNNTLALTVEWTLTLT